jgi:hypothetical protein
VNFHVLIFVQLFVFILSQLNVMMGFSPLIFKINYIKSVYGYLVVFIESVEDTNEVLC